MPVDLLNWFLFLLPYCLQPILPQNLAEAQNFQAYR